MIFTVYLPNLKKTIIVKNWKQHTFRHIIAQTPSKWPLSQSRHWCDNNVTLVKGPFIDMNDLAEKEPEIFMEFI